MTTWTRLLPLLVLFAAGAALTLPAAASAPPNPLREAVRLHAHGWVETLRASGFVERNAPGPDSRTALEMAIETADVKLIRGVLSMGGAPDVHNTRDIHNRLPRTPSLILALKANRILLGRIAELRLHGASGAGRDNGRRVATLLSQWPDLINAGELVAKLLGASPMRPPKRKKRARARARSRGRGRRTRRSRGPVLPPFPLLTHPSPPSTPTPRFCRFAAVK